MAAIAVITAIIHSTATRIMPWLSLVAVIFRE
jgi:hypothetical protein